MSPISFRPPTLKYKLEYVFTAKQVCNLLTRNENFVFYDSFVINNSRSVKNNANEAE